MNQRFDPNDSRPINPASWPAEQASQRVDPVTGAPVTDPERAAAEQRQRDLNSAAISPPREARSMWPVLIVLLAGVVLALLFWLPGEQASDPAVTDTATPPATTDTVTPPASDTTTTPEATPNTGAAPDSTTTTPDSTAPDTTGTATQPAPATGTDQQQPATGTTPQASEPAPQN